MTPAELEAFTAKYNAGKIKEWRSKYSATPEDIAFIAKKPTIQECMTRWNLKTEQSAYHKVGIVALTK